jgi:hypothetical protein
MLDLNTNVVTAPDHDFTAARGPGLESTDKGEDGYSFRMVTVTEAVDLAVSGQWDVPEFQREFVWKPAQVCALATSLWYNYPIGPLLLWQPRNAASESPLWIADGQQRLTSLCLLHGAVPSWFRRKPQEFRVRVRRRFDIRFDISARTEPRFVAATASATCGSQPWLVPTGRLMALDPESRRGRDELERLSAELKAAAGKPRLELDQAELYGHLRRACMMGQREIISTLVNHQQRDDVLEIFARLNSRGMRFRRLLLKLMMEEIPASIRGMRGRLQLSK